jgi:hypothetical protein
MHLQCQTGALVTEQAVPAVLKLAQWQALLLVVLHFWVLLPDNWFVKT